MNNYDEIAVAAAGFYAALNALFEGNVAPMVEIWSHEDDVTYMGPDGGFQVGWTEVRAEWEKQSAMNLGGHVEPVGMRITVRGDLAIANNFEKGANTNTGDVPGMVSIRATNLFRKESGTWKMIGHHADKLPYLSRDAEP